MKDIELVIRMPGEMYDWLANGFPDKEDAEKLWQIVKNGTSLDDIRAEIEKEYNRLSATRADETLELGECLGLKMALKILNKHKEESEGKTTLLEAMKQFDEQTLSVAYNVYSVSDCRSL